MMEREWSRATVDELAQAADEAKLSGDRAAVEAIVAELREHRRTNAAKSTGAELQAWLDSNGPEPSAEWLDTIVRVAGGFAPGAEGGNCVYLILLWNAQKDEGFAVYVGQSARSPEKRFEQHREGYKASKKVSGAEHLTGMHRSESERIELELRDALRAAGITAYGH